MKIQNSKLKITRPGFTLIEMLVAVFIFVILFLIAASFVNLAVGSTKSVRTKMLTTDIRNAMDTISQKLNNANGKADMGTDTDINGFNYNGSSSPNYILGIAADQPADKCIFIALNNSRLWLKDSACNQLWPMLSTFNATSAQPAQPLTSTAINVTSFALSGTQNYNLTSNTAPQLKIVITAEDTDPKYTADNKITLQTSYTMDYATIKRLQNLP